MPQPGRCADAHELTGVEAERAQGQSALDDRVELVNIQPRGRERNLERKPGSARSATGRMCFGKGSAGPLKLVDRLGVGVEADLQ